MSLLTYEQANTYKTNLYSVYQSNTGVRFCWTSESYNAGLGSNSCYAYFARFNNRDVSYVTRPNTNAYYRAVCKVSDGCSDGYSTKITSCGTGYKLATNGTGTNGVACGKCVQKECSEDGYYTSSQNHGCNASGYKRTNSTSFTFGSKTCYVAGSDTACTCEEGNYLPASQTSCTSDGWVKGSSAVTYGGQTCYNRVACSCPSGYSASTTSCGSGYHIETNGKSGGSACGKCVADYFEFYSNTGTLISSSGDTKIYSIDAPLEGYTYSGFNTVTVSRKNGGALAFSITNGAGCSLATSSGYSSESNGVYTNGTSVSSNQCHDESDRATCEITLTQNETNRKIILRFNRPLDTLYEYKCGTPVSGSIYQDQTGMPYNYEFSIAGSGGWSNGCPYGNFFDDRSASNHIGYARLYYTCKWESGCTSQQFKGETEVDFKRDYSYNCAPSNPSTAFVIRVWGGPYLNQNGNGCCGYGLREFYADDLGVDYRSVYLDFPLATGIDGYANVISFDSAYIPTATPYYESCHSYTSSSECSSGSSGGCVSGGRVAYSEKDSCCGSYDDPDTCGYDNDCDSNGNRTWDGVYCH